MKNEPDLIKKPAPEVIEKGFAGKIPVFCSYDAIIPLNEIKPNPQNPNTHSEKQIKLLAKIIKEQGWRAPITVSTRSGMVVKGHGRLLAAYETGELLAPVDYQFYDTDAEEKADLLADNKIAEMATISNEMLSEMLQELQETDIDMILTGYSEEEIEKILSEPEELPPPPLEQETTVQKYEVVVTCGTMEDLNRVYKNLQDEGLSVSKKITDII